MRLLLVRSKPRDQILTSLQIWAQLYAKAIAGQDLPSLLTQFSAGASAGPAVAGGAAAAGASAAAEEEEEKVEEKEESDEDMGMGLFD